MSGQWHPVFMPYLYSIGSLSAEFRRYNDCLCDDGGGKRTKVSIKCSRVAAGSVQRPEWVGEV